MNTRSWPRHSVVLLAPLIAVAGLGAASGGYFTTSFGWTALAFSWAVIVALALSAPRWSWFDRVWLIGAAAFCAYTFLSITWAGSVDAAVQGSERSLVYLTAVAGALVVLRRGDFSRWAGGLVLGVAGVCFYSLATRLFPTHFGGFNTADYRLFTPVGYWNALAIFAGIALLLGFGVAAMGRLAWVRVASAVALIVLAPTLYFTFSRGALAAVAVGVAAMLALSPFRLRLLGAIMALAPAPAVGALLASHSAGLTERGSTLAQASHDGRKLALELVLLAVMQVVFATAYVAGAARVSITDGVRRIVTAVVAVAIVAVFAGVTVEYGSPPTIARHAYDSFTSTPLSPTDLNSRLLSLSNNGRTVLWHSAWQEFTAHPVVGSGDGGFARWWLAHRTSPYAVQDAHDLYVQTLGELGAIGFVLLALFLGLPLLAALRARRHPLVAPAFGGYAAFLVHCAVDWDWQMPAVTVLALFAGALIVAAARSSEPRPAPIGPPLRIVIGVGALVVAVVAFVGLIGNIALSRANNAVQADLGRRAASQGAKAHRWAPWSSEALRALGQGQVLAGDRVDGLASLRQAAAKDPGDWETWFDIAAVTTGAERRTALARAKALNPQSPEIAAAAGPPPK